MGNCLVNLQSNIPVSRKKVRKNAKNSRKESRFVSCGSKFPVLREGGGTGGKYTREHLRVGGAWCRLIRLPINYVIAVFVWHFAVE